MKKLLLIEILLTISFTLMAEDPAKTYKNPVVNYSLPDPSVIRAEDGYFYLYATEDINGSLSVQLLPMKHVRLLSQKGIYGHLTLIK